MVCLACRLNASHGAKQLVDNKARTKAPGRAAPSSLTPSTRLRRKTRRAALARRHPVGAVPPASRGSDVESLWPDAPVINHLWLAFDGARDLRSLWLESLDSWRPCPQVLWSYDPPQNLPDFVAWRCLDAIVDETCLRWLHGGDIPVQFLTDFASMLIMREVGGIVAGMDVF